MGTLDLKLIYMGHKAHVAGEGKMGEGSSGGAKVKGG